MRSAQDVPEENDMHPAPDEAGLRIETREEGEGVTVLRLLGRAGLTSVDALALACNRLAAARPKVLVIDAADLSFVCSLAIGQFVMLHRGIKSHGGVVRLAGVQPSVAEVLAKTRLDTLMPMFPSVDAAIAG